MEKKLKKIIDILHPRYNSIEEQVNPKRYDICWSIENLTKEGRISYEEGIEYLQKGIDYVRKEYCIEIESIAKDSQLMQSILTEKTTYERETERYRDILDNSLISKLKYFFKNKKEKPFDQLVDDLSRLSMFFDKDDKEEYPCPLKEDFKKSLAWIGWGIGFLFTSVLQWLWMDSLGNLDLGVDPSSESLAEKIGYGLSLLFGGGGIGLIIKGFKINNSYKNLISKAKEIDNRLDIIYFNRKGYFT